jgi:phosphatidylinositol 4-kinase A
MTPFSPVDVPFSQGVKFEPHSFKLNHEMIALMGGRYSQGYLLFQQLTVKAFLTIRPHAEQLIDTVRLMLDTGLPSFKGEPTIKRLRERFALALNERQAADFMMGVIRNAHENVRSTVYDEFQRVCFSCMHALHYFALTLSAPVSKWFVVCQLPECG